jgi:hypothetical protein
MLLRSTATRANSAATKKPVSRMRMRTAASPRKVLIDWLRAHGSDKDKWGDGSVVCALAAGGNCQVQDEGETPMNADRDREVIVMDTRSGGSGFGMIIAGALIAIALVVGIWYLVNNTSGESIPDDVDVTVVQE